MLVSILLCAFLAATVFSSVVFLMDGSVFLVLITYSISFTAVALAIGVLKTCCAAPKTKAHGKVKSS